MDDILCHLSEGTSYFDTFCFPPDVSFSCNKLNSSINILNNINDIPVKEFGGIAYINDIMPRNAVLYEPNFITISKKWTGMGLSFKFSGCLMAQFTIEGITYIAHISTGNEKEQNRKDDFVKLLNHLEGHVGHITNLILFKPTYSDDDFKLLTDGTWGSFQEWGVIDEDRNCYSLSIAVDKNNKCRLFAIYKILVPILKIDSVIGPIQKQEWNAVQQIYTLLWRYNKEL